MGKQEYRSAVRIFPVSYEMPWEDILRDLRRNCGDDGLRLPRKQEVLKYLLRLHLRVRDFDYKKMVRQIYVRPFVVLRLLYELIDSGHEVFRGKGSAEALKQQIREAVQEQYPAGRSGRARPFGNLCAVAQDGPRSDPKRPKMTQEGPKMAQDRPR